MVEEKEQKAVEEHVEKEAPKNLSEFLSVHFGKLVFFTVILLAAFMIPINGKTLINQNQFIIGLLVELIVFVGVPTFVLVAKNVAQPAEKTTPVNPFEEIKKIEEELARIGRDVKLVSVDAEPWEGDGAGTPDVYHYIGYETIKGGIRKPFILSQGAWTKLPTKFSNTRYIETSNYSLAGTRKRPTEPGPRQTPPLIVPKPTNLQVTLAKEEKEEEQEEKE